MMYYDQILDIFERRLHLVWVDLNEDGCWERLHVFPLPNHRQIQVSARRVSDPPGEGIFRVFAKFHHSELSKEQVEGIAVNAAYSLNAWRDRPWRENLEFYGTAMEAKR
jgi:hypothetical protein